MSIATITFEDTDLVNGKYAVNVNVTDAQSDNGLASAAHVTGMFIAYAVGVPEYAEGCAAYGKGKGYTIRTVEPQRLTMILTDVDLDTGQFELKMEAAEGAIIDDSVTPATMSALFIRDAMGSVEFRMACTEYAERLIEGRPQFAVREPTVQRVLADNSNQQEAA